MTEMTSLKSAALTALLTVSLGMLEASASENTTKPGECNSDFAYNTLVPTQVTPALLDQLRRQSGAATVRHEKPGEVYTQEHRSDRLRVFSDEGNAYSHSQCG